MVSGDMYFEKIRLMMFVATASALHLPKQVRNNLMRDLDTLNTDRYDASTDTQPPLSDLRVEKKREPIFNQTPLGVVILIAVILLVHIVCLLAGPDFTQSAHSQYGVIPARLMSELGLHDVPAAIAPLFTYQFLHGGTLHLVMNLAMLLQAGPIAEMGLNRNRDGVLRFIIFFLLCGVFGALAYVWINPLSQIPTIGASGAISGVFAGFLWAAIGMAKPEQRMLRPVITSAVIFLLINVGLAWIGRALNFVPIAWESHLGGFVAGLVLYPMIARVGRPKAH